MSEEYLVAFEELRNPEVSSTEGHEKAKIRVNAYLKEKRGDLGMPSAAAIPKRLPSLKPNQRLERKKETIEIKYDEEEHLFKKHRTEPVLTPLEKLIAAKRQSEEAAEEVQQ